MTGCRDIVGYVDDAVRYGTVAPNGPGAYMIEYKLGVIGTNIAGGPASSIQVFVRDGVILPVLRHAMTATLLDQFLAEECTADVRRLLEAAIADPTVPRPHFEFNRFDVTVERTDGSVVLEDDLDTTEAGTQTVPLPEFVRALNRRSA